MTEQQKRTAQAIVNVFETGGPRGDYGAVTVMPGDAGHLTYGRSQASLASGSLYALIRSYAEAPGAHFGAELALYLGRLCERDAALDGDAALHGLLRQAGADPVMRTVQDEYFDRAYFLPAAAAAASSGLTTALSCAVVYDSFIQGGWASIRRKALAGLGPVCANCPEEKWIAGYVDERRKWLSSSPGALPRTVYRMDAFSDLIAAGKWELELPLTVRGVVIDEAALSDQPERPVLSLQMPRIIGEHVEYLQRALARAGYPVQADSVFGPLTEAALKQFQAARGLAPDGIAGPAVWDAVMRQ